MHGLTFLFSVCTTLSTVCKELSLTSRNYAYHNSSEMWIGQNLVEETLSIRISSGEVLRHPSFYTFTAQGSTQFFYEHSLVE